MPQPDCRLALLDRTLTAGVDSKRSIGDALHRVAIEDLEHSTNVGLALESLRGRSVLLRTEAQLPTVLALLALDGIAQRLILGLPDLQEEHLPQIVADAAANVVLTDDALSSTPRRDPSEPHVRDVDTEWILFTSGTTGAPKMVSHTLASLTGPLDDGVAANEAPVWSTFYDIRRYGGLQILLRALVGGGSMVLSNARESVTDFLIRAGDSGVTHISGTPSHWRRALMGDAARRIMPKYVRLSGEISDQAILDHLKTFFPRAEVSHAFASTEAGVCFDVRDGLAGFPACYVGMPGAKADLKVEEGTLRIRSTRTASRYLGSNTARIGDREGYIDTGDMVERRGDRYHFLGRREGVVNVGGQKVYPEEIEAVLNRHPAVQIARVWARKNPITGSVVAADIVLKEAQSDFAAVKENLLQLCREALAPYKVPATLRAVTSLGVASSGKLSRRND